MVLQTLQLLNTALPRLTFLSVALINDLFEAIKGIMTSRDHDELTSLAQRLRTKPSNPAQPKMSNASVLSRPSLQRLSIASSVMSGGMEEEEVRGQEQLQCDVIALLLKVCLSVCLLVCLSVCWYVCLLVCLSVGMSVCWYVCLSVGMYVCLLVCMSVGMYVCLLVCLSVGMYVCLLVCLSVCLLVCLSVC